MDKFIKIKVIFFSILFLSTFIIVKEIKANTIFDEDYKIEEIASGLNMPWAIDFIDEDRILINEKSGNILLLNLKEKKIKELNNPYYVKNRGQGGLLDIAISPDFKKDNTVFFTYVKDIRGQGVTTLAKAKLINSDLQDFKNILISNSNTSTTRHYGSRITFDEKNHLYFSIGDRGVRENAQNTKNHAGSILRLNLDGSSVDNNPLLENKEIFSFGHRNPQGIFYDKQRKILWAIEHGPRGGDEINIIKKGKNYGWPIVSHGREYFSNFPVGESTSKKGMKDPFKVYIPSIAPSSLIVYSGKLFKKWQGLLFIGALKLQHINIIKIDKNLKEISEKRIVKFLAQRIRDIAESPKGYIYFCTDSGNIYRISPKEKK